MRKHHVNLLGIDPRSALNKGCQFHHIDGQSVSYLLHITRQPPLRESLSDEEIVLTFTCIVFESLSGRTGLPRA
jgi:hypothetical protein